jgi:hypothetical protein
MSDVLCGTKFASLIFARAKLQALDLKYGAMITILNFHSISTTKTSIVPSMATPGST